METPGTRPRLVDTKKGARLARPNGYSHSKNVANVDNCLHINELRHLISTPSDLAVAKSLQLEAWKKSLWDQSLAQCRLAVGVAISFRCSAFSTVEVAFDADFKRNADRCGPGSHYGLLEMPYLRNRWAIAVWEVCSRLASWRVEG